VRSRRTQIRGPGRSVSSPGGPRSGQPAGHAEPSRLGGCSGRTTPELFGAVA
jgi:hypothetical protein